MSKRGNKNGRVYRSLTHPLNRLTGIKKAFLEQVSRGNILLSFLAGGVQSLETAGSINITPEKVFSLLPRGSGWSAYAFTNLKQIQMYGLVVFCKCS